VTVFVLSKVDSYDRSEIIGVFVTLEVAKTIAEAEEPGRHFHWREDFGSPAICFPALFEGPVYQYDIEEFEVREK
jgi:hypothetical protein